MDKENRTLLENFNNSVGENSRLARSYIESMDYENDAFLLNCISLTYRDQAVFKKNGKYRKKKKSKYLKLAIKFSNKAFELNHRCINVLFIRATILISLDRIDEAIHCFYEIIQIEDFASPGINCSNMTLDELLMVQNDAYFRLYHLFKDNYSKKVAKKFLKKYKKGLKKGVDTIYTLDD